MGRVSRYKKTKASADVISDQYLTRKQRKRLAAGNGSRDIDPTDLGFKNKKKNDPWSDIGEMDMKHAEAVTRHAIAKSGTAVDGKKRSRSRSKATKLEGRREGESMNAFNNRLKFETRAVLREEAKKGSRTVERKKEYLKEKKKRRKRGKHNRGGNSGSDDVNGHEEFASDRDDGQQIKKPRFGDTNERPPEFDLLPSVKRDKGAGIVVFDSDEEQHSLGGDSSDDSEERNQTKMKMAIKGGESDSKGSRKDRELAQQRQAVMEQYKLMKQKRKSSGSRGNSNL